MNSRVFVGIIPAGAVGVALLALASLPPVSTAADDPDPTAGQQPADDTTGDRPVPAATTTINRAATAAAVEMGRTDPPVVIDCDAHHPDDARELMHYQRHEGADELLEGLIEGNCLDTPAARDRARFQHAYVLHLLDRPRGVLDRLDELETQVPVEDYALWLRAEANNALDRPGEAAEAWGQIYRGDDSPLHWRARAKQSDALARAERWEEALPILERLEQLFPDYPRRYRVLYQRAEALEQLGRLDEAAEAYQQANFEFPYTDEGERAEQRLQALAADGYQPSPIDPRERYEKYRQLSIDKFWGLAHELLVELREDVATEEGTSRLENEILQRIALNTYHSHDFEGAAEYFAQARSIYEEGHTRGFSRRTIYRFHNFALARLGRFDEAREALETFHEHSSSRRRNQAIARFYERYGRYEDAYELYEDIYTSAQQRRWHFTYLKYKTGRFEEAYENLRRLAERAGGQTRRKYMYWAGRALERSGNEDEAAELFEEIQQARPGGYYGLQAGNRLLDLRQRSTVDDSLLAQADRVGDSAEVVHDAFDEANRPAGPVAPMRTEDPRRQPLGDGLAARSADQLWGNELIDSLQDDDCRPGDGCSIPGLGLPFPTYGLTWNLGQPLLDPRFTDSFQPASTRAQRQPADQPQHAHDTDTPVMPDTDSQVDFSEHPTRIRYNTDGRIYWHGRHDSDIEFANFEQGEMLGPSPDEWTAYLDDTHRGGLARAVSEASELFPELERAQWLWLAGWYPEARRVIRDVALEYRLLTDRSRPTGSPHELSERRFRYYIDNRRRSERADLWGMEPDDDELRFPVPEDNAGQRQLLERQQRIYDRRNELRDVLIEALQEVGDYHMVRQFALDNTWWLSHSPTGEAARYWQMAYPRAFPEQIIPLAEENNVNPYMIWSLMLVESSFNPDSISVADALGLMQVLPRTGLKIADLFGAEDFGPFDLLEEQHSIEQGVFYFGELVRKFHSQELLAFAGYNGGPHRVSGWLDMRGRNMPLDEFVEEIPFDQSRNYAKKVLRFLYRYLRLYEGYDEGLYVGQNLRTDYLEQPDF